MTVLGEGDFKEVIKLRCGHQRGPQSNVAGVLARRARQHLRSFAIPPEVGTVVLPTFQARKRRLEKPGDRLQVTKLGRSRAYVCCTPDLALSWVTKCSYILMKLEHRCVTIT